MAFRVNCIVVDFKKKEDGWQGAGEKILHAGTKLADKEPYQCLATMLEGFKGRTLPESPPTLHQSRYNQTSPRSGGPSFSAATPLNGGKG